MSFLDGKSVVPQIADEPKLIAAVDPMSTYEKPEYLNQDILAAATTLQYSLDAQLHVANWMAPSIDSQMCAQAANAASLTGD